MKNGSKCVKTARLLTAEWLVLLGCLDADRIGHNFDVALLL